MPVALVSQSPFSALLTRSVDLGVITFGLIDIGEAEGNAYRSYVRTVGRRQQRRGRCGSNPPGGPLRNEKGAEYSPSLSTSEQIVFTRQ